MAKRKSSSTASTRNRGNKPADTTAELKRIERELITLLSQHARLVSDHAGSPRPSQAESLTPAQIQTRLDHLADRAKGPLSATALKRISFELTAAEASMLDASRVAYLGPKYSYSHLAAMQHFGADSDLTPVATIATVFQDVHDGRSSFGLVPLENSTDGRIVDTLGMFATLPVQICGEVQFPIHHHLMGLPKATAIRTIHSKPQALSQCRRWLNQHYPEARLVDSASTTEAARLASRDATVAAIASRPAASEYGLQVMASNIEDNPNNITRFAVIGDAPARRSKACKTSLMLEMPHRPGSLADVMGVFKRNRLNLTWIESFPLPGSPQEYLFFIEFEGHQAEAKTKRALAALQSKTVRLDILGSYPTSPPRD